jgi:hypothetical protein
MYHRKLWNFKYFLVSRQSRYICSQGDQISLRKNRPNRSSHFGQNLYIEVHLPNWRKLEQSGHPDPASLCNSPPCILVIPDHPSDPRSS